MPIVISNPKLPPVYAWDTTFDSLDVIYTNNNLTAEGSGSPTGVAAVSRCTVTKSTGKWYWEITVDSLDLFNGTTNNMGLGWSDIAATPIDDVAVGGFIGSTGIQPDGQIGINGQYSSYQLSWVFISPITFGVLLDLDNDETTFSRSGVLQSTESTPRITPGNPVLPSVSVPLNFDMNGKWTAAFKAADFTYTIPAGYSAYDPS